LKLARTFGTAAYLLCTCLCLSALPLRAQNTHAGDTGQDVAAIAPRAETKAEHDAYEAAISVSDPVAMEAAATGFAQRYPGSKLRAYLFQRAMGLYQQANDPGHSLQLARTVLKYDPANPLALLSAAQILADSTHEDDLDREERLQEAAADARAALEDAGELMRPANFTAAQRADAVAQLRRDAHEALATVAFKNRDYREAIAQYDAAIELEKEPVESGVWLRIAAAYDKLGELSQGMAAAEKAIAASEPGSPVRELAEKENARLKALAANEPANNPSPDAAAPVRSQ